MLLRYLRRQLLHFSKQQVVQIILLWIVLQFLWSLHCVNTSIPSCKANFICMKYYSVLACRVQYLYTHTSNVYSLMLINNATECVCLKYYNVSIVLACSHYKYQSWINALLISYYWNLISNGQIVWYVEGISLSLMIKNLSTIASA